LTLDDITSEEFRALRILREERAKWQREQAETPAFDAGIAGGPAIESLPVR
jgi:hypothetical protein